MTLNSRINWAALKKHLAPTYSMIPSFTGAIVGSLFHYLLGQKFAGLWYKGSAPKFGDR